MRVWSVTRFHSCCEGVADRFASGRRENALEQSKGRWKCWSFHIFCISNQQLADQAKVTGKDRGI